MNPMTKSRIASHWGVNAEGEVECALCPRNCRLKPGQFGFCGVRGNVNNEQHTFNYGCAVPVTFEAIETEAVYHFRPGAKTLCVGNIGCMLECDFCQNWETSQVKYLDWRNIKHYMPEDIVELAVLNDAGIISWTYDDPVVWHEFVLDTARLASKMGIKNLYKSSLYIEIQPLKELIEVIDIFSISLKSMSSAFYRRYTKGRLAPVLDAIKELARHRDRHIELSQLVVTGLNDDGTDARNTANWVIRNLGSQIPLHFVGFHPAYKYTQAKRTSLDKLLELKNIAVTEGIEYSYIGNVYEKDVSDSYCKSCGNKLVERFGLSSNVLGLDQKGQCLKCGKKSPVIEPFHSLDSVSNDTKETGFFKPVQDFFFKWNDKVNGVHIASEESHSESIKIQVQRLPDNQLEYLKLNRCPGRIIVTKRAENEVGVKISMDTKKKFSIIPLLDRAHFPVRQEPEAVKSNGMGGMGTG